VAPVRESAQLIVILSSIGLLQQNMAILLPDDSQFHFRLGKNYYLIS